MTKTSKIIIVTIIATSILLGLGYAAIQNITLNITGTAAANPNQSNFSVHFVNDPVPTVSNSTFATAAITDDTNATINVTGLTAKGQNVTATYIVKNSSSDLSSDLSVATTNSNTEYFTLSSELAKTSLKAGETTTVTVNVELTKTPVSESVSSVIGVQLTAIPVQPGEEGSSGLTNGTSQTPDVTPKSTLFAVTNDNIGDYIDLGNDIIDNSLLGTTEVTTDDWRILYKDENTVYAILADYLLAKDVPDSIGINYNDYYIYCVWDEVDAAGLVNGIKNQEGWSSFTNGITGAKAIGSPTPELLVNSYNAKNKVDYIYTNEPKFNSNTEGYDLYVVHEWKYNDCEGYWLAEQYRDSNNQIWILYQDGEVKSYDPGSDPILGLRPVVALPLDTEVTLVDGVWTIVH